jgi:ubiquinone/menaquinone biosynthesis C-methylase UbiE
MERLKNLARAILIRVGAYPNILFSFNPFKVIEFEELSHGVNFSSDDRVLDFGCGDGLQTFLLGKRCDRVVGIDISEPCIARARQKVRQMRKNSNIEFICGELENAGFEDESFDKIFSFCVIEHIPKYREVLCEAHRILRQNGILSISVDSLGTIDDPAILERHKREHSVETYFETENLRKTLTEIGFQEVHVYPIFGSDYARRVFTSAVRSEFSFNLLATIMKTSAIRRHERRSIGAEKGIFLVAKCRK